MLRNCENYVFPNYSNTFHCPTCTVPLIEINNIHIVTGTVPNKSTTNKLQLYPEDVHVQALIRLRRSLYFVDINKKSN